MFESKKDKLFETTSVAVSAPAKTNNQFLHQGGKQSAVTYESGNHAKKYKTTGHVGVDQFGKAGLYKEPRSYNDIANDCAALWAHSPEECVRFIVYLRMINRKTQIFSLGITTKESQSGAELKHESIMRMLWLHQNHKDIFWENIGLFVSAGSCKDIFVMLRTDLVYNGWDSRTLDWNKFGDLILSMLREKSSVDLMKKYLPQLKARNACKTVESQANNLIAKWICNLLFGEKQDGRTYKQYRKLKTSGTAHQWQQLISQKKFNQIDFGKIHGRALSVLVRSKFLKNQGLQARYEEWLGKQATVKYTGYPHEVLCDLGHHRIEQHKIDTIDKQFAELLRKSREENNVSDLIVVRDTSGSMGSPAIGCKHSSNFIAKTLAIFFAEFLEGQFANHWIEFNRTALLHEWQGNKPSEKWYNDQSYANCSTNFQSVIDLFVSLKNKGVPLSDFPSGILCISDGMFNPTAELTRTNVGAARKKLRNAGFPRDYVDNFKILLWNIPNGFYHHGGDVKFETYGDVKNVFYLGGYSAANIKFIMSGQIETAADVYNAALSQELPSLVKV